MGEEEERGGGGGGFLLEPYTHGAREGERALPLWFHFSTASSPLEGWGGRSCSFTRQLALSRSGVTKSI